MGLSAQTKSRIFAPMPSSPYDLLTIIGPTASGKTTLAAHAAVRFGGEVISGDSRQVYRRMNIGTGKDLKDYAVGGVRVPYHLIDIAEPGTRYNVYSFQHDFLTAFRQVGERGRLPILCGGSGLYVESVLRGYRLMPVPENAALRRSLQNKPMEELTRILASYKKLHNTTDTDTRARAIRGIEIEEYYSHLPVDARHFPTLRSLTIGISIGREQRWEHIHRRLQERLREGLVEEVDALLKEGISPEALLYYGLEYKFVTLYLTGRLSHKDMVEQLEVAIRQFSKRQITWFRGMERRGITIHWLDASLSMEQKLAIIEHLLHPQD